MAEGFAVQLPLHRNIRDGAYALHQDIHLVAEQNLKMILLTSPGERVMAPKFGVGLKRYLFEQNIRGLNGELKSKIEAQVKRYLPYVVINDLQVFSPAPAHSPDAIDKTRLNVLISYSIPSANIASKFAIPISA